MVGEANKERKERIENGIKVIKTIKETYDKRWMLAMSSTYKKEELYKFLEGNDP